LRAAETETGRELEPERRSVVDEVRAADGNREEREVSKLMWEIFS